MLVYLSLLKLLKSFKNKNLMIHDEFFETDGGADVALVEQQIFNTTSSDEVLDIMDNLSTMNRQQPLAKVEMAHLNNLLDDAFDEHIAVEYGV